MILKVHETKILKRIQPHFLLLNESIFGIPATTLTSTVNQGVVKTENYRFDFSIFSRENREKQTLLKKKYYFNCVSFKSRHSEIFSKIRCKICLKLT